MNAAGCVGSGKTASPSSAFDGGRAREHVARLVAIGPRPPGSPGSAMARAYIAGQLRALGLKVEEQPFTARTPLGSVRMVNVRAVVPGGPGGARGRLIVAGHYDTKLFRDFTFVGANDGGSSAAFLLELARVLAARANAQPIELVFFDGEEAFVEWSDEDHTYGSRHFVDAALADGSLVDIRAVLVVDMIGDRDLRIKRESGSTEWLTDAIWSSARRLRLGQFVDQETGIEDDHYPFLAAGVPAVDLIDLEYPAWHTARDTLDKVSARSLQAVADALLGALPDIEQRTAP